MEASSSKDTNGLMQEELGLEDLWSELHALKKLYGLLHKTSVKIPNGDDGHDCLDEKTRLVLKKLLDGATHQALRSQAKLVCCTPELRHPPEKTENREPEISISAGKKATSNQGQSQRSNPVFYAQQCKPEESTQIKQEPEPNPVEAESKIRRPNVRRADLTLTRRNSRKSSKSTVISDKGSTRHHQHHQHPQFHRHRHHRRDGESSKLRPKNNNNTEKNQEDPNEQVRPRQSNGELFAVVPAEKRARVEPAGLLSGQSSRNKTRIVGRVDRELTHSKRGHARERPRGARSKPPSRPGSLKEERETKRVAGDAKKRLPQRGPHNSKAPELKEREAKIVARKPRQTRDQIDLPPRKHPPLTRLASSECSSSSQTARANSSASSFSSSRRRVARRVGPARPPPRRMPSQRKNVGPPPPKKPAAENNEEGRLKRFKNKLALIFHHHHHHHHHHLHRDADSDERGRPHCQHRSPWAYLRSALHRTNGEGKGKGNELAKKAPARVPAQQQRGYLYPLLDGLIRHVWGMRRRKRAKREGRKIAGRVQGKKLHWWQRFRRRGGVRLASNKAPRLRLGFNRAHSRNIRNKKS